MRRPFRLILIASALLAVTLAVGNAGAAYRAQVQAGTLRITGDAASDKLVLRLQEGVPKTLEVDVGADGSADFSFDRSTFTAIEVVAGAGDDEVRVDETGGSFANEALSINGGGGADTLSGGAGAETLIGGDGADAVTGGAGFDRALLGAGNDRFEWKPGDGSDAIEAQSGVDLLEAKGNQDPETIDVSANGQRVLLFRETGGEELDIDDLERLAVLPLSGPDTVAVGGLHGTDLKAVDVDLNAFGGGGGDDATDTFVARGTEGADSLQLAGSNGEVVVNGLGAPARLAAGEAFDNVNVRTLGESDTVATGIGVAGPNEIKVDGGDAADVTTYDGTAAADEIQVVANGAEVSTIGAATARLDTSAVEKLVVRGLSGADTMSAVGNLAALTQLELDGGKDGDTVRGGNGADILRGGDGIDDVDGNQGQDVALLGAGDDRFAWDPGDSSDTVEGQAGADTLAFNGSNIGENIAVSANGPRARLTRDIATIAMDLDDVERVAVRALGGADTITAGHLVGTDVRTVDVDLQAFAGGGDALTDTVVATGTDAADGVNLGGSGGQVVVGGLAAQTRVTAAESLDHVRVATLGEADAIAMRAGVPGPGEIDVDGGDGADTTTFSGTPTADELAVVANGTEVRTQAPATAGLDITAVESLVVRGLGGPDTISSVGNVAPLTSVTMDGGQGGDIVRGGNGADRLLGGDGDDFVDGNQGVDVAQLGADGDRFQWDPGDGNDTVEGEAGVDTLDFNGSNIGEKIALSANASRAQLTRDIANIVMDLDDVEAVTVRAFGGADTLTVGDLAGTDVKTANVELQALGGGGGDTQADTVVARGTAGADVVSVTRSDPRIVVGGLAAQIRIAASEAASDVLRVETLAGDDTVTVAPEVSDLIAPVVDLGEDE